MRIAGGRIADRFGGARSAAGSLLALFPTTDTLGDPGYRHGFLIFTVLCAASLGLTRALRRTEKRTDSEEA